MKAAFDNLINDLKILSRKIQKGEKGKDYLIEGEDTKWGVPCYLTTEIERDFERICRKIEELVKEKPDILTVKIFNKIDKAFSNSYGAVDSFRGRTPAGGGDWTDIESLVSRQMDYTKSFLKDVLNKLY